MTSVSDLLKTIGIKQTKQRIILLNALKNTTKPLTAEELYEQTVDKNISLSTIYRTMEMFSEKGIVAKSVINDSDKYSYELTRGEHKHYAICLHCNDMKYVEVCPLHDVPMEVGGFFITSHKLELYGYCDSCKDK